MGPRFGESLPVALRPDVDELVGPEIATIDGLTTGDWMCWRPAEEAFE